MGAPLLEVRLIGQFTVPILSDKNIELPKT